MKGKHQSSQEEVLELGEYTFEILKVRDAKTKEGLPKAIIDLIVLGGPAKGKKLTHSVTFFPPHSPYGWITDAFLYAMGEEKDAETGEYSYDTDAWEGKKFLAASEPREYNGKMQNNVRRVRPAEAIQQEAPF